MNTGLVLFLGTGISILSNVVAHYIADNFLHPPVDCWRRSKESSNTLIPAKETDNDEIEGKKVRVREMVTREKQEVYWKPVEAQPPNSSKGLSLEKVLTLLMPIVISLAVLGAALFIILSGKYDDASQKWSFGTAGMIVGHWLGKARR